MPLVGVVKCRRKSQTTSRLLKVLCDLKQKKRSSHMEAAKSFLYRRTLKQIKQKRSSGSVVHLFL